LIFINDYNVPNFNFGMLCYVANSTSSGYVSLFEFMENNKENDDNDDDDFYETLL
jgi:hypothetical protein